MSYADEIGWDDELDGDGMFCECGEPLDEDGNCPDCAESQADEDREAYERNLSRELS